MRVSLVAAALILGKATFAQSVEDGKRFLYYERYQSAKDAFQKALAGKPNDGEITFWLGQAEMGLKDSVGAKDLYQKVSTNTNDPWALICAGELELKDGKNADARNHFETAISLTKARDANVLAGVAKVNIDVPSGDANYAIEKLNQAIEREKKHVESALYVALGDAYAKLIDGGNAVTNYNNALQADPKYAAAHYKIGLIYETQRNPTQYVPEYEAAIQADPNFAPAYYRLYVHYYSRDVEKSKDYLTQYTAHADPGPLVDQANVDILYASQHFQEAIDKSKALLPNTPDAFKPHYYKLMAYSDDSLRSYNDAKTNIDTYFSHPDDSLTAKNYQEAAHIYYKGGFSQDSIFAFLRKAIAMDTLQANKDAYVQYAAALSDSLHDPVQKAYWVGQVYLMDKEPNPNDLYNWGSQLFTTADTLRARDVQATGISNPYYIKADSVFGMYIDKFPNYSVYGYYWRARANWALDTAMDKGLAVPYFEKMITTATSSKDSATFVQQIEVGLQYMIQYYFKKKDYKNALDYINKFLVYDPTNETFKHYKDVLEKYFARQTGGGGKSGK
ncbi:tetratricopeptide repeat protein [Dinghuibacter silviterrae]|nr:tetratricopeptide repeat protein [Dinghuibacter silviterrae]